MLPQTQCTRCGFPACRPYAEAIARGEADINRCPPGGSGGIEALAALTGRPVIPLDPDCGVEQPLHYARIVAHDCIGCTKCIRACPVDAIVGGPQRLHVVLRERCTGCELCIPPCPVDCIELRPWQPERSWSAEDAWAARKRHALRNLRTPQQREEIGRQPLETAQTRLAGNVGKDDRARAILEAAIEKARKRLQESAR